MGVTFQLFNTDISIISGALNALMRDVVSKVK